ncbi:alkaline phosphatase PhoX [Ferrimonas pelagia]|uniref:Alkaline phosphatase n=1 Tax=Ferrimonas pelagia TaxID=1177826 RepID=A0ABP9FGF7_9GAMM
MKQFQLSLVAVAASLALTGCWNSEQTQHAPEPPAEAPVFPLPAPQGTLMRFATAPLAADLTGLILLDDGTLQFNVRHPGGNNGTVDDRYKKASVGVLAGSNVYATEANKADEIPVPPNASTRQRVLGVDSEYQFIGVEGQEGLGVIDGLLNNAMTQPMDSNQPNFSGLLSTGEDSAVIVTSWGTVPGGISRIEVVRNAEGGWDPVDTEQVDLTGLRGGLTAATGIGVMTPWGTPLIAETEAIETARNATTFFEWNQPDPEDPGRALLDLAAKMDHALGDGVFPNPYDYGYMMEVLDPNGDFEVIRRYAMGRVEYDRAIVMPDNRTLYLSQNAAGGAFYKFVAHTAGDLSEGTLSVGKVTQEEGKWFAHPAVTSFDIDWVELGSASEAEVLGWVSDFDGIDMSHFVDGQSSYLTDADVVAWANGDANYPSIAEGGNPVTAGLPMDDRVVFLETRQAGQLAGGTVDWTHITGFAHNYARTEKALVGTGDLAEDVTEAFAYFSIPRFEQHMLWNFGDIFLAGDNGPCGGVYQMKIEEGYDIRRIEPVLMGGDYPASTTHDRCDGERVSQPGEILVMDDGRLLISEEYEVQGNGGQLNSSIWLWDPLREDDSGTEEPEE